MAETPYIRIRGASENNLKNIDVDIPKNKLVVITGLSGSGKSSLAFDTIYADGQRRYMESLSSYARQFLGQMKRPNVESIEGLSPAISTAQKSTNHNPRSTVGTVTEIYDYLRLLYGKIGIPHCPKCGREIKKQSVDLIIDQILALPEGSKIMILAPVIRGKKGHYEKVLEQAKNNGYIRVCVDGDQYDLSEEIILDKDVVHNIEIIVDRLVVRAGIEGRLNDSLELAFKLSDGLMIVDVIGNGRLTFSQHFACPDCNINIGEIEPRSFSFNNPCGACPDCFGLGYKMEFDEELMIPDKSLCIDEGAIIVPGWQSSKDEGSYTRAILNSLVKEFHFSLSVPFESYPKKIHDLLIFGTNRSVKVYYNGQHGEGVYDVVFKGIIKNVERRYRETSSDIIKAEYETFMHTSICKKCNGQRLKKESLAVIVADKNIFEITALPIKNLYDFFKHINLSHFQRTIGEEILKEIQVRIRFLIDVGLNYLNLSRATSTLSGGELQRIRLATQIGSGLVGVDYILDEPSIGLHQRDNDKLLNALCNLRDLGNSVLVVEHDEETMRAADYIIDMGPGSGVHGGEIIGCGTAEEIMKNLKSVTGDYLSGRLSIEVPKKEELQLDKVINIDQSPIGRTPRSNPATYIGVFDIIRELFAVTTDSKVRGYNKGRFSFNVKGGRCEACKGDGILRVGMQFLPDVFVPCEVCKGKRYNRETLEVLYKGKNIHEILDMTVEEAVGFFENFPKIHRKIQTLFDVGLSYIKLGQPATTLSGGEAQRVKLATELSRKSTGRTIYILDEPTTELHFADVHKLTDILQKLVEGGNTVVVNEGISREGNIVDIAVKEEIIEKGGSWFSYRDTMHCQGRENSKLFLKENPDIAFEIENLIRAKYNLPLLKAAIAIKEDLSSTEA